MKYMISILTVLTIGLLVLSGFGVAAITRDFENHPPNPPKITGPTGVPPGTYEYTFKATDSDEDNIKYYIDWGDDNIEETEYYASGEKVQINHTFLTPQVYLIRARAIDIHDYASDWGEINVRIFQNRQMINLIFPQFFIHLVLKNC